MRVRPTGHELLSTARAVLRERLLPQLSLDDRQTAHAIGRAMAIAAHELEFARPAQPEDIEMLETAHTALRDMLLTRLPVARRYDARLVAKAIAIAATELRNDNGPENEELAQIASLLREAPPPAANPSDLRRQLTALCVRLASEIRQGSVEPGSARYSAVYAHLRKTTLAALSESHPAYLKMRERASERIC